MGANAKAFIEMREEEYTINATFKVKGKLINTIENYLNETSNLISYKTIQNTNNMYKSAEAFRNIVKEEGKIRKIKEKYINDNMYKYR